MKNLLGLPLLFALVLGTNSTQIRAATSCTVEKQAATCDWRSFREQLASAHLMRAEYNERDRAAGSQLKELVMDLGKTVADQAGTADLTIKVVPASESGVDVGLADEEILQLLVYSGNDSKGPLVWVETYNGQKDRSWPANVHAAIQQFRERIVKQ